MARRAEPSAKTIKDNGSKPRAYKYSIDTRFRKAEAELSAAIESTMLPCVLAFFKDFFNPNDFELLMDETILICLFTVDVVAHNNSPYISRELHEFVLSPKSKQRVLQLIESAAVATVLLQDSEPSRKLPPDLWEFASLLTRFVALTDLYLWLVECEQQSIPSIRFQKNLNPQVSAVLIEEQLRVGMRPLREAVHRAYWSNQALKTTIQQRFLQLPKKQEPPRSIHRETIQSSFDREIGKYLAFWGKDCRVWARKYEKWKDERMQSWEWYPEKWNELEQSQKLEEANTMLEPVVMVPGSIYDFVMQRVIAAKPNVAAWRPQEGFENLLWAPCPVFWSKQARKKGSRKWLLAYEKIDTLPTEVWTSPGFSELILDLIDIVYHHWSKIERPPSFSLTDAELFHYRGRIYPEVSEREQQQAAMRQLQQFRFFHKEIIYDYENEEIESDHDIEEIEWGHQDEEIECENEGLLRCTVATDTGRKGKFSEYTYQIEILRLWRGRFERPPGEAVVHGAACSRKLWAQSGRKRLVRQLVRYLRTEWRWNARLYALDKQVRYFTWRELLEQCDVPLETVESRPSEFYSRLATALTSLHEEEFLKAWHLRGANKTEFVTGYRNTDDMPSSDESLIHLQSLVCDPLSCVGRKSFNIFLKQKVGFVPHDSIVQALMPVAKRQQKKHI